MRQILQVDILPAPEKRRFPRAGLSVILILLAFLIVAGCSEDTTPAGEKPQPPGVLVEYTRTGGIAGFADHLVVFSDGQVVYSTREGSGAFLLSPGDLDLLRGLIRDADIPNLKDEYPALVPGADYFTYILVIGNRTITTETTGVPASLTPVISTLDGMLSGRGASS
ncbi:MAG: hypothetical protein MUC66_04615 [Methanolinea sp.]|nr:hypothetical protein [Methanolinea sp.]